MVLWKVESGGKVCWVLFVVVVGVGVGVGVVDVGVFVVGCS